MNSNTIEIGAKITRRGKQVSWGRIELRVNTGHFKRMGHFKRIRNGSGQVRLPINPCRSAEPCTLGKIPTIQNINNIQEQIMYHIFDQ